MSDRLLRAVEELDAAIAHKLALPSEILPDDVTANEFCAYAVRLVEQLEPQRPNHQLVTLDMFLMGFLLGIEYEKQES